MDIQQVTDSSLHDIENHIHFQNLIPRSMLSLHALNPIAPISLLSLKQNHSLLQWYSNLPKGQTFTDLFPLLVTALVRPALSIIEILFSQRLLFKPDFNLLDHLLVTDSGCGKFFITEKAVFDPTNSLHDVKRHLNHSVKALSVIVHNEDPKKLKILDGFELTQWKDCVPLSFQLSADFLLQLDQRDCAEAFFRSPYFTASEFSRKNYPSNVFKHIWGSSKAYSIYIVPNKSTASQLLRRLLLKTYKHDNFYIPL